MGNKRHEQFMRERRRQAEAQSDVIQVKRTEDSPKRKPLPDDAAERKQIPIYTGFIRYFPDAIAAVAKVSLVGGIQHGQTPETLHWDRSKSKDELDAMMRHILDEDWEQVAWRALANLQKQIEKRHDQ